MTTAYLRFYLTIFPAMVMTAFWLMARVVPAAVVVLSGKGNQRRLGVAVAAAVFALVCGGVLTFAFGDLQWEKDHPPLAAAPQTPLLRGRRPTPPGPIRRSNAEAQKVQRQEDMDRLSSGTAYVLHRLPGWAGLAALLLGVGYGGAWWLSGRSWSVLGANTQTGAAAAGAGLLALAGAAMSLYLATPDMESTFRAHLQQAEAAKVLVDEIGAPPGSLVFSDELMLKHLQFVGDYQVYNVAQFTVEFVRSLSPDRFDPDQPQMQQPERAELLYSLLHKYTQKELVAEERHIVDGALAQGKHVYVMIRSGQLQGIRSRYFPPARYKTMRLAIWQEPPDIQPRAGRPAGRFGPMFGAPPPPRPSEAPQTWLVMEVFPLPPVANQRTTRAAISAERTPDKSGR
jgi:hypothetical protein